MATTDMNAQIHIKDGNGNVNNIFPATKIENVEGLQTALNSKANTSDVTSGLANKVDKETGKGLSTNDYTTTEKNKLSGIEAEANKTVVDSALSSSSTNPVQNKVVNTALGTKQDTLSSAQLAAVNSGIDSSKVTQISTNQTNILSLQGRMSDAETDIATQTARIDNIASLPSGSTSGDAELIDIRTKADGTTATNAGAAVREQVNVLSGTIEGVDNKFTSLNRQVVMYPDGMTLYGYMNGNGEWNDDHGAVATDYVDVRGASHVKATGKLNSTGYAIALFDADHKFLAGLSQKGPSVLDVVTKEFDLTGDYKKVAYVRVSVYNSGSGRDTCGVIVSTDETWIEKLADINLNVGFDYPNGFIFTGYVNGNGEWYDDQNAKATGYIDISDYSQITAIGFLNKSAYAISFFDSSKNFIQNISQKGTTSGPDKVEFTFDPSSSTYANAKYIRVSVYGSSSASGGVYGLKKVSTDANEINEKFAITADRLNLVNPSDIKDGGAYNFNNGVWSDSSSYNMFSAGTAKVKPLTAYNVSWPTGYIVFWDKDMKYIGGHGAGGTDEKKPLTANPVVTPANCEYMTIHEYTTDKATMFISEYVDEYQPYSQKISDSNSNIIESYKPVLKKDLPGNNLSGKTINAFGDSITSTDYRRPNWWEMIASRTGVSFVDNGYSGDTLAHTDDRHLWNQHFVKDDAQAIGYDPNDPSTWSTGNCFCERIGRTDNTTDGIIIMGGTNDGSVPRGAWDSSDTSTFFGALNTLLPTVLTRFAGKPILVCTPIQAKTSYTTNVSNPFEALMAKSNNDTLSIQLRAEAIKAKCRQYGVHCLDLYNESGINGVDGGSYYIENDTLHPSDIGQARISIMIQRELERMF